MTQSVERGDRVKHTISGFEGVVIARIEWLNGCVRFVLQAEKLKDGKTVEETFDAHELKVVKKYAVQAVPINLPPLAQRPGGPASRSAERASTRR